LLGYTYRNTWKGNSYSFESLVNTLQYNNVQGFNIYLGLGYRKNFDREALRWMEVKGRVNYGFSEKIIRTSGEWTYSYNRKKFSLASVSGGREVTQFNEEKPIAPFLASFYGYTLRRNFLRLFDKTYLRLYHRTEITNGLLLHGFVQWARRSSLENHSDFSFFYRDSREFASNVPENDLVEEGLLLESRAATLGISLRLRPGQKFLNYPDRKYIMGSDFPDLWIHYRKGIPISDGSEDGFRSDVNFDRLSVEVTKRDITLGLGGVSAFSVELGKFLNDKSLFFNDFKHFNGNQTNIGNPANYLSAFKMLPYYEYSTPFEWVEGHWEHNFKGLLTDKIPGVKKLGWSLIAGTNFLYTKEEKGYWELSLGFDNLGFGAFRLFRIDVVSSFDKNGYLDTGYLIGLMLPVDEVSF
jgi:hypothetical protein